MPCPGPPILNDLSYPQPGPARPQDKQYLANAVARLSVVKPDVVLVEGSVARMAQEDLLVGGGWGQVDLPDGQG
jgi:hypothetical protein